MGPEATGCIEHSRDYERLDKVKPMVLDLRLIGRPIDRPFSNSLESPSQLILGDLRKLLLCADLAVFAGAEVCWKGMAMSLTSQPRSYRLWLARRVEVILPRAYKYRASDVAHSVLGESELA